jgi:hypothetical protein
VISCRPPSSSPSQIHDTDTDVIVNGAATSKFQSYVCPPPISGKTVAPSQRCNSKTVLHVRNTECRLCGWPMKALSVRISFFFPSVLRPCGDGQALQLPQLGILLHTLSISDPYYNRPMQSIHGCSLSAMIDPFGRLSGHRCDSPQRYGSQLSTCRQAFPHLRPEASAVHMNSRVCRLVDPTYRHSTHNSRLPGIPSRLQKTHSSYQVTVKFSR